MAGLLGMKFTLFDDALVGVVITMAQTLRHDKPTKHICVCDGVAWNGPPPPSFFFFSSVVTISVYRTHLLANIPLLSLSLSLSFGFFEEEERDFFMFPVACWFGCGCGWRGGVGWFSYAWSPLWFGGVVLVEEVKQPQQNLLNFEEGVAVAC